MLLLADYYEKAPEECHDLIENMTGHHNDWDTSAQRNESSSSITSSNPEITSLKLEMEEMNRNLTKSGSNKPTKLTTTQDLMKTSTDSMQTQKNNLATSNQILERMLGSFPKKLSDLGNFSFPCGLMSLKCKALADLGASINLMPLSVWKKLGLPKLISTQMTLELANRDICTPKGIARDVFVPVGKFTFLADFVIVDYESDPRVPLILGRPFLRTARALIDVHGEEMILRDGNERLILNMRNDTSSYSNEPHQESINMIDVYNVSHEEIREDLFATNHPSGNPTSLVSYHTNLTSPEVNDDIFYSEIDIIENLLNLDKTKDLPPYHDNQSSGNPTPISKPETKNEILPFDAESDLLELEYLLNHDPIKDMDSILEDSVDENSLDDNLDDTISEMFTDEHALDYSSPPLWDDYDDNLFDHETVNDDTYDDPFDSKEEKIKDSKILIDDLIF
ncbi:reverse transcriptase domain-containing protein [Tanacetum coccineum]